MRASTKYAISFSNILDNNLYLVHTSYWITFFVPTIGTCVKGSPAIAQYVLLIVGNTGTITETGTTPRTATAGWSHLRQAISQAL